MIARLIIHAIGIITLANSDKWRVSVSKVGGKSALLLEDFIGRQETETGPNIGFRALPLAKNRL